MDDEDRFLNEGRALIGSTDLSGRVAWLSRYREMMDVGGISEENHRAFLQTVDAVAPTREEVGADRTASFWLGGEFVGKFPKDSKEARALLKKGAKAVEDILPDSKKLALAGGVVLAVLILSAT